VSEIAALVLLIGAQVIAGNERSHQFMETRNNYDSMSLNSDVP
jgi:hypothetical protein